MSSSSADIMKHLSCISRKQHKTASVGMVFSTLIAAWKNTQVCLKVHSSHKTTVDAGLRLSKWTLLDVLSVFCSDRHPLKR